MTNEKQNMAGLSTAQARQLQNKYGKNELTSQKKESFIQKAFHIICEPMFLLLIVAAIICFFSVSREMVQLCLSSSSE